MSWIITGTQKLDPDAAFYIDRVEAADGQSLEEGVKLAYITFVSGCKTDGIWDAIKASCILAGARTLNGALQPLVGTEPTNYNFVTGDYNRETGLVGDGSTKYLDSNRNNNADPQNNSHASVYITTAATVQPGAVKTALHAGGSQAGRISLIEDNGAGLRLTAHRTAGNSFAAVGDLGANTVGLFGASRSISTTYTARSNNTNFTVNQSSDGLASASIYIFARETSGSASLFSDGRLAFYSIGESLDLALLDARVTTLMSDLAAAIV